MYASWTVLRTVSIFSRDALSNLGVGQTRAGQLSLNALLVIRIIVIIAIFIFLSSRIPDPAIYLEACFKTPLKA